MAAAAIGAIGSVVGGVMGMQQASYQAKVAKMNEQIAKENASRAIDRSHIEQEDFDRFETANLLGEQEAAQSASGLTLTGKSQVMTRAAARKLGRRDALNIIQAGEIEAYNYRTQAANFAAQAKAAKMSGTASLVGSFFSAAGQLASSAYNPAPSLMSTAAPVAPGAMPVPKPAGSLVF